MENDKVDYLKKLHMTRLVQEDLAMMLRKFMYLNSKEQLATPEFIENVQNYLKKYNLEGSILRSTFSLKGFPTFPEINKDDLCQQ